MLSPTSWTRFLHPMIDIVIHVDGKTFPANKAVLSQHSGYFRTVLSPTTTSLILPTVPADYFALLLASMTSNTTPLEINEGNVYQLLLYAQLLQMPAMVLQCKAFLANHTLMPPTTSSQPTPPPMEAAQQPQRPLTSTVVRPIPNKVQPSQLWKPWLYSASFYQDWISRLASQHNQALNLAQSFHYAKEDSSSDSTTMETKKEEKLEKKLKKRSKSSSVESENLVEYDLDETDEKGEKSLDIAACDGPVRFHRILNPIFSEQDAEEDAEDPPVDVVSDGLEPNAEESFVPSKTEMNSGATYKCVFCNHIFKSHYCYQKHKRRHLNPFTVDFTSTVDCKKKQPQPQLNAISSSTEQLLQQPSTSTTMPSTSLKDINVQFFPCKICGAKFPSYYFVHKHKKIWHPETVVNTPPTNASTSCNTQDLKSS